jgi:citrate lyase subunit beta / citryl-CoA lyase
VRINELASDHAKPDFDSLPGDGVSGLLIPKPRTAQDLSRMGQLIADARSNGKNHADLALMPIATEVPEALFHILDIAKAEHVRYLTWGAEDLAAAVGALSNTDEHGRFTPTFVYARTQCLLAASAANIVPVDAASMQIHDSEALKAECQAARRDGFVGKLAIHPAQIDVIHEAFAPSADELEWAQKVIAAFDEDPDRGAFRIDGKMIDKPHLRIAQRIVDAAQIGAA